MDEQEICILSFFLHLARTFALITVNTKQYWADYNFLLADSFHSLFPSKLANQPANSTLQYISVIDFSRILFFSPKIAEYCGNKNNLLHQISLFTLEKKHHNTICN